MLTSQQKSIIRLTVGGKKNPTQKSLFWHFSLTVFVLFCFVFKLWPPSVLSIVHSSFTLPVEGLKIFTIGYFFQNLLGAIANLIWMWWLELKVTELGLFFMVFLQWLHLPLSVQGKETSLLPICWTIEKTKNKAYF